MPLRQALAKGGPPVLVPAPAPVARIAAGPPVAFVSGEAGTPGHQYRIRRMAAAAGAAGWTPHCFDAAQFSISLPRGTKVVWMWRCTMTRTVAELIASARRVGASIVYDIDDLMVEPWLANPAIIDGMRSQRQAVAPIERMFASIRRTMMEADLCVATTDELAAHMRTAGKPAIVIPNGFDHEVAAASRAAKVDRPGDGLLRIGYAAGSRTHQRDFVVAAEAVAQVLRARPDARLVLFSTPTGPLLDLREYEPLQGLGEQVEMRDHGSLATLPAELARFDINLAPLEVGNPFCEAKSNLKYFEAALCGVPTIASDTGPFMRAIRHLENGLLAGSHGAWGEGLGQLAADPALRRRLADRAAVDVLWTYGPERRAQLVGDALDLVAGGRRAAAAFAAGLHRPVMPTAPKLADAEVCAQYRQHERAEVTVLVPLHNYARYVIEALDSVLLQTLADLDLVVVDDGSTDGGLGLVLAWAANHAGRFGSLAVVRHRRNAGLAVARNTGFVAAQTPYVLPLDADNRLWATCAASCLAAIQTSSAAFAYPVQRKFGEADGLLGIWPYSPARLISANYIDALALVSRAAWAAAGGYHAVSGGAGWEDYDLWCRLAELGLSGQQVAGEPLADYRVHGQSMSNSISPGVVRGSMARAHPWLRLQ